MYYIMSDPHFNHDKLCREDYSNRPPNFSQKILNNLFSTVTENDILICLGDVYWTSPGYEKYAEQMKSLQCYKVLVMGNHDRDSYSWFKRNGFDFVCEGLVLNWQNLNIYFSHEPRYDLENNFDLIIHGHLHNNTHRDQDGHYHLHPKHFLVAQEYMAYRPMNLDKIIQQWKDGYEYVKFK